MSLLGKEELKAHCFAICFIFSGSTSTGIRDCAALSMQVCNFSRASSTLSLQSMKATLTLCRSPRCP